MPRNGTRIRVGHVDREGGRGIVVSQGNRLDIRNGDDKLSDFMWTKESVSRPDLVATGGTGGGEGEGERGRVRGRKGCQNDARNASSTCLTVIRRVRACTSYQLRKLDLACPPDQLISWTRLSRDTAHALFPHACRNVVA